MKPTALAQKSILNYDQKKPWSSPRGISVGLILFSFVLSLLELLNSDSFQGALGTFLVLVVFAPFLYFTLKGKIWAMVFILAIISIFILLTLIEGSYQGVVWNLAIIYFLILSIQIEQGRKRK